MGFVESGVGLSAQGKKKTKWTLGDLADLEALLAEDGAEKGARRIYREEVAPHLKEGLSEVERRRQGLRLWLEAKREGTASVGKKLEKGLLLAGFVVSLLMFLVGASLVRGMLMEIPGTGERGYNLWLFLGVTLGIQWLVLVGGFLGWLVWRRKGHLSVAQELIGWLGRKLAGGRVKDVWEQLSTWQARGYGSVLGWRLGRISQMGGEWLNFGMLIGFLGVLWFLKVGFYWESTLEGMSQQRLVDLTNGLSLPWASLIADSVPGLAGVESTALSAPEMLRESANNFWIRFLALALVVWGLFPRILLYAFCRINEDRALAKLDFQEIRHRNLWREMAKVERKVVHTGQEDGVVLLDVGGTGLKAESVRPFLLQRMRVNPEAVFQTGVLDAAKEQEAVAAMKQAALGVVLVVEGWSLSGPEMKNHYERVRKAVGEGKPVRFLVVGVVKEGEVNEVSQEEFLEWVKFVDGLRDPAVEVVRFER